MAYFYAIYDGQQGGGGSDRAARRSPRPIVAHEKISTNCPPPKVLSAEVMLAYVSLC